MKIELSSKYIKSYQSLIKKSPDIHQKTKLKLKILIKNPRHPSLRLEGKLHQAWTISIQKDVRLVFTYVKNGILLLNIGSHDKVY